jgi:hypothetical protein
MNDNRTLRQVFGDCLATRGPYYRKVCALIAERVAHCHPSHNGKISDGLSWKSFQECYEEQGYSNARQSTSKRRNLATRDVR